MRAQSVARKLSTMTYFFLMFFSDDDVGFPFSLQKADSSAGFKLMISMSFLYFPEG